MIDLASAVKEGRLDDFIAQEEGRGVGPADPRELDEALSRLITAGKSEDRTSRSASSDGSSGTRTR
jgi:hypothetical protein